MSWLEETAQKVIKAYDIRGLVNEQITDSFVYQVGSTFATLMLSEGAHQIIIGHDMRESSPSLADAFAQGVIATGLDVVMIGLCSTDQLYWASGHWHCPGAMFTASHNPAQYNGIKLCRADAKPIGADTGLDYIQHNLTTETFSPVHTPGTIHVEDTLANYASFLHSLVDLSELRPLTIAVDAGNGMAGLTAPAVLATLEPFTVLGQYFELDGTFPNHEANPLDPANLVDLQHFVQETGADIGLAFDGDADRCFVIDEHGHAVSPSVITALIAERELLRNPHATIIYNLITSRVVPQVISECGGIPVRSRVGHSYIKALMAQTGAVFGGEHSAHYYFRDFWSADSGMLAALHVLAALGQQNQPLSQYIARYQRYAMSGEINYAVEDMAATTERVLDSFAPHIKAIDDLDGVTVDLDNGAWFNLRPSNTESLLRLNVEAAHQDDVDQIVKHIHHVISPS